MTTREEHLSRALGTETNKAGRAAFRAEYRRTHPGKLDRAYPGALGRFVKGTYVPKRPPTVTADMALLLGDQPR
jgi:hypothetical protein